MTSAEQTNPPYFDRTAVTVRLIDRGFQFLATVTKGVVVVVVAAYAAQAIAALAGKQTDASFSFAIEYIKESHLTDVVFFLFGAIGITYGVIQKRLRRRTIAHFSPQVRELELALDSKRSSSELAPDGRTNPLDT